VYVARGEPDGKTSVMFGDGRTGARLPTGRDNVKAVFRVGIGLSGLAAPGQISLPLTRPPGLKAVRNPFSGAGAEDPEGADAVRRNAPLGTLAVERVVSLADYGDFARAFAGIAKAIATWSWTGLRNEVVVTAAGPAGAAVPYLGKLATGLTQALTAAGDPTVPVRVVTYRSVPFRLEVRVATDADRVRADVLAAVRAALLDRFSFGRREFGQSVALSEVMACVQAVPGVSWVDVDVLARPGGGAVPAPVLEASGPCAGAGGTVLGAELLVVDPRSLLLGDPT
jgi:predicted phage baseplate assembly protein